VDKQNYYLPDVFSITEVTNFPPLADADAITDATQNKPAFNSLLSPGQFKPAVHPRIDIHLLNQCCIERC